MDIKTHEMLSLISKAIAQNPRQHEITDQGNAKTLTQQQIHGQQDVHSLRGNDDTMMSHTTVPSWYLAQGDQGHPNSLWSDENFNGGLWGVTMIIPLKMNHQSLVL